MILSRLDSNCGSKLLRDFNQISQILSQMSRRRTSRQSSENLREAVAAEAGAVLQDDNSSNAESAPQLSDGKKKKSLSKLTAERLTDENQKLKEKIEKQQADMEKQLGMLRELQGRLDVLSSFQQQKRAAEELESDEEEGEYEENEDDAGDYSLGMNEDTGYGK